MNPKYFTICFVLFFILILVGLGIGYNIAVQKEIPAESLRYLWASLIFMFVLFGIIIISLVVHWIRERTKRF